MKITRRQLRELISESIRNNQDIEFKYIDQSTFNILKKIDLKSKPYPRLSQELAQKYYSEKPGQSEVIYIENRIELGGSSRGMNKLTYRPRWGDPVLIRIGTDPKTGKGIFMSKKPLVSTSEAGSSWTGNIYLIFGEYVDWEGNKRYGETITQSPAVYNLIPKSNKKLIDSGVYVEDRYFSQFSNPRSSRRPYLPCKLDSHLTDIYSNSNLIEKADSSEELIESLIVN